jgi:D-alanyl-D-alanine carboxypeptidase
LGLYNTHFENPNGLDSPGHYSTARDLARLTAYAMENPIFHKTVSTKNVRIGERSLQNHNKLLWSLEGADGVKTGFTKAAGRILVSSAVRNGRRLVAVTMNDPDDWQDHAKMMEYGFSEYNVIQLLRKGDVLGTIEVVGGKEKSVKLLAAHDLIYSLSDKESVDIAFGGTEFVYAPISAGQSAGTAYLRLDGKTAAAIPMVFADTVEIEPNQQKTIWQKFLGEVWK